MNSLQETLGTFLIRVFLLMPLILFVLFLAVMIIFLTSPKGSEKRKRRRRWFILTAVFCGVLLLLWIGIVAYLTFSINHA